ncbi:MAG: hypothetical protein RLN90_06695 [Balneolaceae bacterium]
MKLFQTILFCLLTMAPVLSFGQESPLHIQQILASYDTTSIVAFGERHNQKEVLDFYLELIHSEKFQQNVNDIVLELGNSLYQKELDDFIYGKSQSEVNCLSDIWRSATNSLIQFGDDKVVRTIIREVQKINKQLPLDKKIRVLVVDPPINWDAIEKSEDFWPWLGRRDRYFASIIWDEVIDKNRNAFFIAGRQHLFRNDPKPTNYIGVVELLEARLEKKITIIHLDSDVDESKTPQKLTEVLESNFSEKKVNSNFELRYKDAIDAVLYLGELNSIKTAPYSDSNFLTKLNRRSQIVNSSPFKYNSYDYLKYLISEFGVS